MLVVSSTEKKMLYNNILKVSQNLVGWGS